MECADYAESDIQSISNIRSDCENCGITALYSYMIMEITPLGIYLGSNFLFISFFNDMDIFWIAWRQN